MIKNIAYGNKLQRFLEFFSAIKIHSQAFNKSLVFSTNALAGEVGELCNLSKKLEYYEHFPTYQKRVDKEIVEGKRIASKERVKDELGDCLFYLLQCALRANITPEEIIDSQRLKLINQSKEYKKIFKK